MSEVLPVYAVDDDPQVLQTMQAVLTQVGLAVRTFSSAEAFLASVDVSQPGCLVTDVSMPGMDGLEFQRRLVEAKSPLSVIVVSGVASVPMTVTVMQVGAATVLEKPYNPEELVRAVKQGLESSRERNRLWRDESKVRERLATLSEEEIAIMEAMLADEPNKATAGRLDLSMRTVDRRRRSVLDKMGVSSIPELALLLSPIRRKPTDG